MKPNVIAISGKIGSGKSTVAKILEQLGFVVIDCDALSRKVSRSRELLCEVQDLLGENSVANGELNRKYIREKIFCDDLLYESYSNIFWHRISTELKGQLSLLKGTVFVEIAVLDAFDFDWTEVWWVESSLENQISRVLKRDGVDLDNVKNILAKQKKYQATRTIQNDGSLQDLENIVKGILEELHLQKQTVAAQ